MVRKYKFKNSHKKYKNTNTNSTRTSWAVFKYCGTKAVQLRIKK
jgi:hypothetical protein